MEKKFSSKIGFILTAVGSAVGMANIWGFPYKFQEGGLVFLIFYLAFVILFSYVGLSSEFAAGRMSRKGSLGSYEIAFESSNKNKRLARILGYIPLLALFLIAIGYSVIVAYVSKAFIDSLSGQLFTMPAEDWFNSFSSENYGVVTYHIVIIILTILTCIGGAKTIEKSNKIMMPTFFVLFLILVIRILFLDGSIEGYRYMFRFDPSKLNLDTIIAAMGQAFFSLSLTGAAMVTVGSYTDDSVDLMNSSKQTGLYDTIAALLASCVMIPALSVFNMQQVGGPGLLFISLPTILQNIAFGRVFSIILYLAVIFAGISSLQNMFEPVVSSITGRFDKLSRNLALLIIGLVTIAISLNMETIDKVGHYMDIVSIYIMSIGASIGSITWFYILKKDKLLAEINKSSKKTYGDKWYKIGKYVYVPIAVVLTLIALIFKISF